MVSKLNFHNPLDKFFLFCKKTEKEWPVWKKMIFWIWRLAVLLAGAAAMGYITLKFAFGAYPSEVFDGYLAQPMLVFWNVIPAVWLIFALYALFGRAWLAFGLGGGVVLGLSLGNFFKLLFRDDPLIFEDLMILREAGLMATGEYYHIFIDRRIALALACLAGGTLFLAVFARGAAKNWKGRLALVLAAAVSGGAMLNLCWDEDRYDAVENFEILNQWNQTQNYIAHGCLYPFVYSIGEAVDSIPEGYTKRQAEELLSAYSDADIPEEKKVNVITIMREAYVDFSKYDIPGLDVSGYDVYHRLQSESYCGTLFTNIFAGGTIDSERSFLTGIGANHTFRTYTNSYLWYFREQGYTVEGSHPYLNWFYNRDELNPYIGFERYRFQDDGFVDESGSFYVQDRVLYAEILKDYFKNKSTGKPYFSFSLTMQSHGPYYTDICLSDREYLTGDYTESCKNAVNNYMYEIMGGDQQLWLLVDELRAEEEPVVLVVFSDHLPWMGDGNVFYEEMGVDVDVSTGQEDSFRTRYETDYLIWANDAAKEALGKEFAGEGPTISPLYLMNLVFEQCGWEGNAYMQAMGDMMEVFPVVTSNDVLVVDGKFMADTNVPEERRELLLAFEYLQYYWRNEFLYQDLS